MSWQFATDRPIYSQLVEHMSMFIIKGLYPAGSRLPSVRDLAAEAKVNPNTMQKALAELENMGLVYAERTSGRFVTEDTALIQSTKQALAQKRIEQFFADMESLGINWRQALTMATAGKEGK
ncbi:MAG: GntR family transcriptional regulator [Firmicutes bacterium]|nr:GntR family transcriptional regulator [Bacillota bacterium]